MVYSNFFRTYKSFLRMLSVYKTNYCFLRALFWYTHMMTRFNIFWWYISISFKIFTTFSSKFWSEALSGVPVISILFLRSYCSNELWSFSVVKILRSRTLTFFLRRSFSTWRFLITSFKFKSHYQIWKSSFFQIYE